MNDMVNKNMFIGDYCYYDELKQNVFVIKCVVVVDYLCGDSFFMYVDILLMNSYNFDIDFFFCEMCVFYKVCMYSIDLQGVCDFLVFNMKDFCFIMYCDFIFWNEG